MRIIIVANYKSLDEIDGLMYGTEFRRVTDPYKDTTYQFIGHFEINNPKLNNRKVISESLAVQLRTSLGYEFELIK